MSGSAFISERYFSQLLAPPLSKKTPKNLLICPKCLHKGIREILGEVNADGSLTIKRFHKGQTTIVSQHYSVQCTCGETVYHHLKEGYGTASIW